MSRHISILVPVDTAPTKPVSGTYSFAQAAARLGIGLAQAYRLDQQGRFPVPVIYLGRVKKVRVAELEAWLQGNAPQQYSNAS